MLPTTVPAIVYVTASAITILVSCLTLTPIARNIPYCLALAATLNDILFITLNMVIKTITTKNP